MLHSEARELLVQGYEAAHDAKGIAKAYSVSKWTVYRPAEQIGKQAALLCGPANEAGNQSWQQRTKKISSTVWMRVRTSQ